jgi:hypothetical protein
MLEFYREIFDQRIDENTVGGKYEITAGLKLGCRQSLPLGARA